MSKNTILLLGIIYAIATFILNNVLHTTVGGLMLTLSYLSLGVAIISAIYYLIKRLIKQFIFNRK